MDGQKIIDNLLKQVKENKKMLESLDFSSNLDQIEDEEKKKRLKSLMKKAKKAKTLQEAVNISQEVTNFVKNEVK